MITKNPLPEDLQRLDSLLADSFQPIKPDQDYRSRLRVQLEEAYERKIKTKQVTKGILVAGGVVGGLVMIVTIIRSLTGEDGGMLQIRKTITRIFQKQEQTASA